MTALKRRDTEDSKEHWEFVEKTAAKVNTWPSWKQASTSTSSDNTNKGSQQSATALTSKDRE